MLVLSVNLESPEEPGVNEWDACPRPLGIWASLWLARITLSFVLYIWRWKRERVRYDSLAEDSVLANQP